MNVLHCASEFYPLISTGGLGSVASALPRAQQKFSDLRTAVVLPWYGEIRDRCKGVEWLSPAVTFLGEEFGLGVVKVNGLRVFLVARDEYFEREGPYGPWPGASWPDNPERFSFFSRAVTAIAGSAVFPADLVHCHDWQTSLVPVYLRAGAISTVLTVHNLQFQGRFGSESWHASGLPDTLYSVDGLEFWGDWNCLKGGIVFADMVTTVSPGYAAEIRKEKNGWAMDGILRSHSRKLRGILNGIDTESWDPSTDPVIPARFKPGSMRGRKTCRSALERDSGFSRVPSRPIIGMVSRLTWQKGIDLVLDNLSHILKRGFCLRILGTGDEWAEEALQKAASNDPDRVSVTIAYDDVLARRIFAGSDCFLMPSRFEPCGLGQMMAMRYGSVPLVKAVGGLRDTVDRTTGFRFSGGAKSFRKAVDRMAKAWKDPRKWAWYRRRCMSQDFSWEKSVGQYEQVYEEALAKRSG